MYHGKFQEKLFSSSRLTNLNDFVLQLKLTDFEIDNLLTDEFIQVLNFKLTNFDEPSIKYLEIADSP